MEVISIILALVAFIVGGGAGYVIVKRNQKLPSVEDLPEEEVNRLVDRAAKAKLDKIEVEAEEKRAALESKMNESRRELVNQENLQVEREKSLNERSRFLDQKAGELELSQTEIKSQKTRIEELQNQLKGELEKISGLTRDEAKKKLLDELEGELVEYKARLIREAEKRSEEVSDEAARKILVECMQRIATDYVGETTTTVIKIDDDKVKARIIGKEGRNIRAFEMATGVDVNIDEAEMAISISSFDPLRREIARVALVKLIKDGRIHPASIEDEVRKAKNEIAVEIKKNGQILAEEANWHGMDIGLIKLIGKMKYRTSYGQSLMSHSIEVVRIGAVLAAEIGADVDLVKKACLLHDVGKVLTHKIDGPHHHISGQVARKYSLPDKLVNAIEAHHLDIEPRSPEAVLVYIADAISGARPGARKDSYEQFIKRVEGIENVAKEVGGNKLESVYAIKAGREVRVIVNPKNASDDDITLMSKEIADKIRSTQTYPGAVQVTVIRETRSVDTAM